MNENTRVRHRHCGSKNNFKWRTSTSTIFSSFSSHGQPRKDQTDNSSVRYRRVASSFSIETTRITYSRAHDPEMPLHRTFTHDEHITLCREHRFVVKLQFHLPSPGTREQCVYVRGGKCEVMLHSNSFPVRYFCVLTCFIVHTHHRSLLEGFNGYDEYHISSQPKRSSPKNQRFRSESTTYFPSVSTFCRNIMQRESQFFVMFLFVEPRRKTPMRTLIWTGTIATNTNDEAPI